MENLLKKKLATVEMSFLEHFHDIDSWNSGIFDIFNWLDDMEKEIEELKQIHVTLLNDGQVFYKEHGKRSIDIYENSWDIKPGASKQICVVLKNEKNENQEFINHFISLLIQFLTDNKITYHDNFETKQIVKESWSIVKIIEVKIGNR